MFENVGNPEFIKSDPCMNCTLPICNDRTLKCQFVQLTRLEAPDRYKRALEADQKRAAKATESRRNRERRIAEREQRQRKRVANRQGMRKSRLTDRTKNAILSVLLKLGEQE